MEENINIESQEEIKEEKSQQYSETVELPSGHTVELRGMKAKEIDILANKRAIKSGNVINQIAKNCILSSSEGFDYDTALIGDRYVILLNIRKITYPRPYEFKVKCPSCEEINVCKVNLEELEIKKLEGRPTKDLEFVLPRAKKKVIYHLPTGVDEAEMFKYSKKYSDSLLSVALMIYTDKVEGLTMKKLDFFRELDAYDVMEYQEEIDKNNCGVETTLEIECKNCLEDFEIELPITKDFFLQRKVKKT